MPEISSDIGQEIAEAGAGAYQQEAVESGEHVEDMPFLRHCTEISRSTKESLEKQGFQVEVRSYSGWDVTHHDFLILNKDNHSQIVDPTWKQFLGANDADMYGLPDVLILDISSTKEIVYPDYVPERLKAIYNQSAFA